MTRCVVIWLSLLIVVLRPASAGAGQDPWVSVRTAAGVTMERHPQISAQSLRGALIAQNAGLETQVIRLDPQSLLIAVQRQGRGEVFIITLQAGHARVAWSAVLDAARGRPVNDPLTAWRLNTGAPSQDSPRSPLSGTLIDLPAGPGGERRFAINADHTQAIGATVAAQLSIWRWNGGSARPLFVTAYDHLLSDDAPVILAGGVLRIRQKGHFETFSTCGACEERRQLRIVALTQAGTEDRGLIDLDPDLALIDTTLDRILKRQPVGDQIDPQVVGLLEPLLTSVEAQPSNAAALGGLVSWSSRGGSAGRTLCLSTDETGALYFRLRGRGAATRVTQVRVTQAVGCDAPSS